MKTQHALPELFTLKLVFDEYDFRGSTLKNVVLDLFKPDAHVEDLPPYPLREMIVGDLESQPWGDSRLMFIARDCFSRNEVDALERHFAENPLAHATLKKRLVTWPTDYCWCDFGGYGSSTISLRITEAVEAYAYSAWDFVPEEDTPEEAPFVQFARKGDWFIIPKDSLIRH